MNTSVRAVKTHQQIDQRSLAMAKAKATCQRWFEQRPLPAFREWLEILSQPWEDIRAWLLDESELGQRLRQSDAFCGILTPQERWQIYQAHREPRWPRTHHPGGGREKDLLFVTAMLKGGLLNQSQIESFSREPSRERIDLIRLRCQAETAR